MDLDLRTIFLMDAALYLMLHGAIWLGLTRYRSQVVALWSASGMVSALGLGFLGSRDFLPEWTLVVFGQLFMAFGNWGRQMALKSMAGPCSRRWLWGQGAFNGLYLASSWLLFYVHASEQQMMLLFCAFYTVNCLEYYWIGRRLRDATGLDGAILVMVAGLVFSGTLGVKSLALAAGWGASGMYDMGWDQGLVIVGQFVAISLINVGFLRLFVDRLHRSQLATEQALAQQQAHASILQNNAKMMGDLLRERDEIIRQLTLSNKTAGMGALVASMAHELSQPLTTIVLKTELIDAHLTQHVDVQQARQLTSLIREDTRHASAIIRTLRSMFTLGRGEYASMDFSRLLQDVLDVVKVRSVRAGIELDVQMPPAVHLMGDSTQLQQVVLNLLNNAMDALLEAKTPGPQIRVLCRAQTGFVELKIHDNGPGIDAAQQADVFALFKTTKSQGMGVGLWLSQAIVQSHGGYLGFESHPGQGALFSLRLPVQDGLMLS